MIWCNGIPKIHPMHRGIIDAGNSVLPASTAAMRLKEGRMVAIDFTPRGVCSKNIHVELDDADETIERIEFTGGCNGNLKAISKLVAGQPVEHVTQILRGNTCGPRKTRVRPALLRPRCRPGRGSCVIAAKQDDELESCMFRTLDTLV